jgi:hypothetical protein
MRNSNLSFTRAALSAGAVFLAASSASAQTQAGALGCWNGGSKPAVTTSQYTNQRSGVNACESFFSAATWTTPTKQPNAYQTPCAYLGCGYHARRGTDLSPLCTGTGCLASPCLGNGSTETQPPCHMVSSEIYWDLGDGANRYLFLYPYEEDVDWCYWDAAVPTFVCTGAAHAQVNLQVPRRQDTRYGPAHGIDALRRQQLGTVGLLGKWGHAGRRTGPPTNVRRHAVSAASCRLRRTGHTR